MNPWELIAIQPMINILITLSNYLFSNFGLAVIALTLIVNGAMAPLTLKQIRASRAMQEIQPKMAELQKRYAKDRQKLAQEQMRLYKESGMSPAGCLVPMLIQMPVWIALYQSVIKLLAATPEDFLGLSEFLYSWPTVFSSLPLNSSFLWLNLGVPDMFMAILVAVTMFLQQRMSAPQTSDPKQQTQNTIMQVMMPLMFAYIALILPSGLGLFWVTSSVFRIFAQYLITGRANIFSPRAPVETSQDKKYKYRGRLVK